MDIEKARGVAQELLEAGQTGGAEMIFELIDQIERAMERLLRQPDAKEVTPL